MGVINWIAFGGILVDLVIISIIISTTYWGYRRGLVAVLMKFLTFLISLIIVFLLYKPVANSIIKNTELDEKLANGIKSSLSGTVLTLEGDMVQEKNSISDGVYGLIESFVKEALQKNEVDPIGYVSIHLAEFMIRIGTMLLLFIVSRFFLLFIRFAAEIIANLPIIKMFNKSGGLVFGVVKGFFTVYLILAIFSLVSPLINKWGIIGAIDDSTLGSKMYNNNIIINILIK